MQFYLLYYSLYVMLHVFHFAPTLCAWAKRQKNVEKLHCFPFIRCGINDTAWHKNDSDFSLATPFEGGLFAAAAIAAAFFPLCGKIGVTSFVRKVLFFDCEWRITSSTDLHPITLSFAITNLSQANRVQALLMPMPTPNIRSFRILSLKSIWDVSRSFADNPSISAMHCMQCVVKMFQSFCHGSLCK